jgi:subtilase family serine protease
VPKAFLADEQREGHPCRFLEVNMLNRSTALLAFCLALFTSLSFPQTPVATNPLSVKPIDRLTEKIDAARLVTLSGSRHPLARAEYSLGQISSDQSLQRMVLVLRPDATQEAALEELLRAQQDPASAYYHRWLTPQSFGQRFGLSPNDLAQIVGWLQSQGMQVDEIPASHRNIVFSGSAGQVQSAFHTSIQRYRVGGESHYANATDPQIPQALAPAVLGIVSLHDFRSASQIVTAPSFTASNGAHFLAPQDWDVIYDVGPLFRQGLDGTGQSIAVLGRVDVALSDVRSFRHNSGLPPNDPQMIVNGPDPGFPDCNDEVESALDVEWAGAIASNATIKFVTSKSGTTDGINLSALYAVNQNVAPIVTLSYGLCEAAYSTAGNSFWNSLWAQAAAQGMSVFVSSGDSGAAGCDSMNAPTATHGRGVNALCSSSYSTCVGGTQFDDVYNSSQYWRQTNGADMSSAISYIPEIAWNESGWSNLLLSSGGGASSVYLKPAWQSAPGVPPDGYRDVPDVSMTAAIHDAYIVQIQGGSFYVAGTSAATPSLASVMALVLENTAARQGNANPTLYRLATSQMSANGAAIFHDITSGSNSVPGVTGFNAGTGYDLATGLGSIDANLLVNHWSDRLASTFTLSPSPSSATVAAGASTSLTITETAQNAFSSPVSLSASELPTGVTATFSPSTLATPASSTATFASASSAVPGTYAVTVTGTGGGLTRSTPITLTVAQAAGFKLTASASAKTVATNSSASFTLTTAAIGGFKSALAFSVTGYPKGVTATFSPATIASPGNGSSILKVTVPAGTLAGTYNFVIKASGGGVSQTNQITVTIVVPNFTLITGGASASVASGLPGQVTLTTSIANLFNSSIALSVSSLPKGITASFSPATLAAPGSGSSTLTLTEAAGAASGTYNLTLSANGGGMSRVQPLSLTVVAPTLAVRLSVSSVTVKMGGVSSVTVTTTGANRFNAPVALSVSGLPKGVTATFAGPSVPAPGTGSSTLTLKAASTAIAGTYSLNIVANGGGLSQTQKLTLTLTH